LPLDFKTALPIWLRKVFFYNYASNNMTRTAYATAMPTIAVDSTKEHLVLTALPECWPKEGSLALLGPWCVRHTEQDKLATRRYRMLPSVWQSRDDLNAAHRYVENLQEQLIPALGQALNRMHGTSYSAHYWRIMLGAWLLSFLPALYERFVTLEAACRDHPDAVITGLDPSCFTLPASTIELPRRIIGDHYNLQLFTRLLRAMGRTHVVATIAAPQFEMAAPPGRVRQQVKRWLGQLSALLPVRKGILTHASYFSRQMELSLALRLRGRLRALLSPPFFPARHSPDPMRRAALRAAVVPQDRFTRLLQDILPQEIPACFIEGYAELTGFAARHLPAPPAAVLSANAWYYDEAFKHWAAQAREQGTRLLGIQHGGNYGGGENLPSEAFEIGLVDRYYSWGWNKPRYGGTVCPMPAPKLVGRTPIGADRNKHGILLATTHLTRYPLNFITSVTEFEQYLAAHQNFVEALPPAVRSALRVRLHCEDFGWDIAARWRDFAPDVPMESWSIPFTESLRECRIYVCDHHSTTFLEALSADKPTVLFWDPGSVDLAPEYAHLYQGLRDAGILHDTPASAARHLQSAYDDVICWWQTPAVQSARIALCNALGQTTPDALTQWANELRAQVRQSPRIRH